MCVNKKQILKQIKIQFEKQQKLIINIYKKQRNGFITKNQRTTKVLKKEDIQN
jgi:hypothetical protein